MTTLETILEVLMVAFAFVSYAVLAVLGVICLFRPQIMQVWAVRENEQYKGFRFARWLARWYPFYAWGQAFVKTPVYLWHLRFCGVLMLIMASAGVLIALSPLFAK